MLSLATVPVGVPVHIRDDLLASETPSYICAELMCRRPRRRPVAAPQLLLRNVALRAVASSAVSGQALRLSTLLTLRALLSTSALRLRTSLPAVAHDLIHVGHDGVRVLARRRRASR